MEKINLVNRYKSARSTLIAVIVFSIINCFLLLVESDYSFLYSTITPQLAIVFAKYVFSGFTSLVVIVMFGFVPLILYGIAYLLSDKDWKWLRVATILFAIDIVVYIFYFINFGFQPSNIIDVIFEGIIMVSLVGGTIAGKELNNDFEVEEIHLSQPGEVQGESSEETRIKVYNYDKQYAKKNKTNKTGLLILGIFAIMLLIVVAGIFFNSIIDNPGVILIIVYAGMIGYVVLIVKLSPFLNAKLYQYFVKDGVICRNATNNNMIQSFVDLKVENKKEDSFICTYQKKENKRKKLVIPNCYPNIEEILKY